MKWLLMRWIFSCLIGTACLLVAPDSIAQEARPDKVAVGPMAVAHRAIGYSLLPPLRDQIPGNAVVWYGHVYAEQQALTENRELWGQIRELVKLPASELSKQHSEYSWLGESPINGGLFRPLQKAARSRHCDWQLLSGDEPFFEILLPEIQRARSYSWLIALRTKYQIAEDRFDDAIESLQLGFALARNVAHGDTLVCTLVGKSIEDLMLDCLFDWVQQKDAPNLAWALAELPNPLVDLRPGLNAEMIGLEFTYPLFAQSSRVVQRHLGSATESSNDSRSRPSQVGGWDDVEWTTEQWSGALRDFWDRSDLFGGRRNRSRPALDLLVLEVYPIAKASLINVGYSAKQVEAMSVAQTIAVQCYDAHQTQTQNLVRWAYQPTAVAMAGLADESKWRVAIPPVLPIDEMLGNSIRQAVTGQAKVQRRIALLRLIEAIRDHAATHEGALPLSLDAIEVLPVPNDPATGTPFEFSCDGSTARVAAALGTSFTAIQITVEK